MTAVVPALADPAADRATVGGKGASPARLTAAGLPVPGGFQVTTRAYRDLVATGGLTEVIGDALVGSPETPPAR